MTDPDQKARLAAYFAYLAEDGFRSFRAGPAGQWVGLYRYAFTTAIVKGVIFDRCSIIDRWCYTSGEAAEAALAAWDCVTGEPDGWLRHPASGRCRYGSDPGREVFDWAPEAER